MDGVNVFTLFTHIYVCMYIGLLGLHSPHISPLGHAIHVFLHERDITNVVTLIN